MQFFKRYKKYGTITSFVRYCPKRILTFKRPKWKKIQVIGDPLVFNKKQKRIKKKSLSSRFNDNSLIKNFSTTSWQKLKLAYLEGLNFKNAFYLYFNHALTTTFFKSLFYKNKKIKVIAIFAIFILKPLFFLEILLWKLNFFSSVYQARQAIKSKKIRINDLFIKSNCILRKGDIVTMLESIPIECSFKKTQTFDLFSIFFEIDYYTNTIILIKDFTDFSRQDFCSLAFEPIRCKTFLDYIQTK